MSKFTLEYKLECIEKIKNHEKIDIPDGYKSLPSTFYHNVRNWHNAYRINGLKALSTRGQNLLTHEQKLALVRLVIAGKTLSECFKGLTTMESAFLSTLFHF